MPRRAETSTGTLWHPRKQAHVFFPHLLAGCCVVHNRTTTTAIYDRDLVSTCDSAPMTPCTTLHTCTTRRSSVFRSSGARGQSSEWSDAKSKAATAVRRRCPRIVRADAGAPMSDSLDTAGVISIRPVASERHAASDAGPPAFIAITFHPIRPIVYLATEHVIYGADSRIHLLADLRSL